MNVILLTRHFPPVPSGGARRPFLMAKALTAAGHEVYVCSPSTPKSFNGICVPHPQQSPSADMTVAPNLAPVWRWGVRQWARELLRWPDPDANWAKKLAKSAIDTAPFKPDLILTTSPSESVHLAGHAVKRHYGCAWLADFRDCWLHPPHRKERRLFWRKWGETIQARYLLASADKLIAVDETVADEIARLTRKPVAVIRQLMPESMINQPRLSPSHLVHLAYTGQISIGDANRTVAQLLKPFEDAWIKRPELYLTIAGQLTQFEILALQESVASKAINYVGALPLDEVLSLQARADALIVLSSEGHWAIPGKYFEYRATGNPIIAIGGGQWRQRAEISSDSNPKDDMLKVETRQILPYSTRPVIVDGAAQAFLALIKTLTKT